MPDLFSFFFALASLLLALPVLLVSLVVLFYPDPFRDTKISVAQTPHFSFEHERKIESSTRLDTVLATATDEMPVFVLYGSKRCSSFSGAYALFHKYFEKYNVYVVFDDDARIEGDSRGGPILFKFGTDGNIIESTSGLWNNLKMKEMLDFEEESIKIFG